MNCRILLILLNSVPYRSFLYQYISFMVRYYFAIGKYTLLNWSGGYSFDVHGRPSFVFLELWDLCVKLRTTKCCTFMLKRLKLLSTKLQKQNGSLLLTWSLSRKNKWQLWNQNTKFMPHADEGYKSIIPYGEEFLSWEISHKIDLEQWWWMYGTHSTAGCCHWKALKGSPSLV